MNYEVDIKGVFRIECSRYLGGINPGFGGPATGFSRENNSNYPCSAEQFSLVFSILELEP